jgi:hypothetical protein
MNEIKIMIFLWQIGVVDSLTFFQFCMNCGAQYTGLTLGQAAGDIGPSVLLAPVQGLGTSYQYVRAAQGLMERRARIATIAAFMAMSGRATLTDPATHMKSVIEKSKNNSTGGLVFANPAILSKFTNDELIALNVVIVGGVLLIIISYYLLPRIAKDYWNYSKKSAQYTLTSGEKIIRKIKKSRKIRKLGSKIFVPFKYIGFIEIAAIKVGSSSRIRNKIL